MKKIVCFLFFALIYIGVHAQINYVDDVNPFIGTGGHGHTYPGATLPHGMVQLSPDTRLEGWDGCSGYHYSDSFIYGFSHTHLSGTGCSDYGDVLIMPGNGIPNPIQSKYRSAFNHRKEKASPGYYAVHLEKDDIYAELTATERVGYHHYLFNSKKNNFIIIDLKHRDEVIESSIKIEDSVTISGLRRSKAWANNQYVYFVMKFSQPIKNWGIWENDIEDEKQKNEALGKNIKAYIYFERSVANDVFIKVAISPVSVEGAKRNLDAEVGNQTFNEIKNKAVEKWNIELSKIDIKSTDKNQRKIFYTALYHTAIVPNINMDVDGSYRGMDNEIHQANGFIYYSVFSLWDTYRAAHPLYTIIDKKRTLDYIKTFLVQYQQGGRLPVWELASCETDCMIGYHSVPVIVDAYMKGISDFDTKLALEAMLKSANWNHLGLPALINQGVINIEDEHESVSKQLEYAYDDYCIAIFAKSLGDDKTYREFLKRAQNYKNLFDAKSGFMRPRKNGGWLNPFEPREVNNHFTEANSWQYSFYFPQDINGYIKMIGGKNNLEKKLDALFTENSKTTGRDQSDITGLIGQYAHGNEPSHHIAYLYNYTNHPSKTQFYTNKIMKEFYKNEPDGLIGNEDCGQMSAWYVLSALGFYPVTPGDNTYMIGSPQFSEATIHLENRGQFIVSAPEVSNDNIYIKSASLNNYKNEKPITLKLDYINYNDISEGGKLMFKMISKPKNRLQMKEIQKPLNEWEGGNFVVNPTIEGGAISFKEKQKIEIHSIQPNVKLFYTTNGSFPTPQSNLYTQPFFIDTTTTIKAIGIDNNNNNSFVTTSTFKKANNNWEVRLNTSFEPQYEGGGASGLIDGIYGTTNWRMGNWQGYQLNDFDAVINLKEVKNISSITASFLQDVRPWIVMPKQVTVSISLYGKDFYEVYNGTDFLKIEDINPQVKNVQAIFLPQPAQYIRIVAKQYGKLPSWHEGAGGDTHLFVDEIIVE